MRRATMSYPRNPVGCQLPRVVLWAATLLIVARTAAGAEMDLSLRTRDAEGRPRVRQEAIDPAKVGIVVVDMWNYHWCKTATMRVAALVPRMNAVLDVARDLGMTVMLCPSDVVDNY